MHVIGLAGAHVRSIERTAPAATAPSSRGPLWERELRREGGPRSRGPLWEKGLRRDGVPRLRLVRCGNKSSDARGDRADVRWAPELTWSAVGTRAPTRGWTELTWHAEGASSRGTLGTLWERELRREGGPSSREAWQCASPFDESLLSRVWRVRGERAGKARCWPKVVGCKISS